MGSDEAKKESISLDNNRSNVYPQIAAQSKVVTKSRINPKKPLLTSHWSLAAGQKSEGRYFVHLPPHRPSGGEFASRPLNRTYAILPLCLTCLYSLLVFIVKAFTHNFDNFTFHSLKPLSVFLSFFFSLCRIL